MQPSLLKLSLLASVFCAVQSAPLDWYVSPSGDDGNSGSASSPFATPGRALAALAAAAGGAGGCGGDATIHLSAGEWYLSSPLVLDGAHTCGGGWATRLVGAGARAAGAAGGGTVLSAGALLRGWAAVAPGVYSAPAPPGAAFVRALFARGASPPAARRLLQRSAVMTAAAVGQWGVRWAAGDAPAEPGSAYAEAEVVIWHQWTNSQNKIAQINATTVTPVGTAGDPFFSAGGKRWALQNVAAPLALAPGQFYFARGQIVYAALPGEDPTAPGGLQLIAELLPQALIIGGSSAAAPVTGVAVANLTIAHAAAALEAQCLSSGCGGQSNSDAASAAVRVTFATGAALDQIEVTGVGGYAVWLDLGCTRCSLTRSLLHDLGQGGVRVGNGDDTGAPATAPAHSCAIADTVIADGGHVVPAGTGVLAQEAANTTITHNHVHHMRYTGISTGWTWGYMATSDCGQEVSFNLIHDIFQRELTDGGCIYNLGRSPGTRIVNNMCHDVDAYAYGGWGLCEWEPACCLPALFSGRGGDDALPNASPPALPRSARAPRRHRRGQLERDARKQHCICNERRRIPSALRCVWGLLAEEPAVRCGARSPSSPPRASPPPFSCRHRQPHHEQHLGLPLNSAVQRERRRGLRFQRAPEQPAPRQPARRWRQLELLLCHEHRAAECQQHKGRADDLADAGRGEFHLRQQSVLAHRRPAAALRRLWR